MAVLQVWSRGVVLAAMAAFSGLCAAQGPAPAGTAPSTAELLGDGSESQGILAADAPPPAAPPLAPALLEPAAAPRVASAATSTKGEGEDALFPRYTILKPNVAFWTRVFGEYSEFQSLVHSADYPDRIVEVLDFRDQVGYLSEGELYKLRRASEIEAKERVEKNLAAVDAARNDPASLRGEQRRIYELFDGIDDPERFARAAASVRTQRGLRERTRLALETAGNYLPAMEAVFRGYELPLRLTRLPLVESSFNVEAYSKVGAAGLWQFMPASARIYMRLNDVVDDRRDPWTSTDGAARHLRDDYAMLGAWPLAITAYNHGRNGISRGLAETGGTTLPDLIRGYTSKNFGFASRNFYAEFLAASDVERQWKQHFGEIQRKTPLEFEVVETKHYVPYETLRRLCNADDSVFSKLNPAYRPEVIEGRLYVPPGHLIRVPAGAAKGFEVAYARLGSHERFDQQRVNHLLHRVKKGESLGRIAKRYGVTQDSIRASNGLGKKGTVRVGQVLKILPHREARPGPVTVAVGESKPGLTREETRATAVQRAKAPAPRKPVFRTHKVKSGQTLSSIAETYAVSIAELRSANGLGKSSHIRTGQNLKVPHSG